MGSLKNYVVLGALLGSLLLASIANKLTASVALPGLDTAATQISVLDGESQTQAASDSEEKATSVRA